MAKVKVKPLRELMTRDKHIGAGDKRFELHLAAWHRPQGSARHRWWNTTKCILVRELCGFDLHVVVVTSGTL